MTEAERTELQKCTQTIASILRLLILVSGKVSLLFKLLSMLFLYFVPFSYSPLVEQLPNFLAYLKKHRYRIHNYYYFQCEDIPIGSGAVESLVKQIDRRVQISGAQWNSENLPQVLNQRCAYLNGYFSSKHNYLLQS